MNVLNSKLHFKGVSILCLWAIALVGSVLCAGQAQATLKVSITLEGDVDTLIQVLEYIKSQGLDIQESESPLKFEVHSISSATTQPPQEIQAEEILVEEESLAVQEPTTPPLVLDIIQELHLGTHSLAPGETTRLSVAVEDPRMLMDTMTARLEISDDTRLLYDLLDDGTRGDETAGDGVWSTILSIPAGIAEGDYKLVITPYDAYGAPIMYKDEHGTSQTIAATTRINVTP